MKIITCVVVLLLIGFGCATTPTASNTLPDKVFTDVAGITLTVYGMSCPLCANNLDGQLMRINGVESADIDLDTGAITVMFDGATDVTQEQIGRAVRDAGFTLRDVNPLDDEEK